MTRSLLLGSLLLSSLALAQAPKTESAPAPSPEVAACMQKVEARDACKEQFCQMRAEVIAERMTTQMAGQLKAADIEKMKPDFARGCLQQMKRENASEARRRATCEEWIHTRTLANVPELSDACGNESSCEAKAACLKPMIGQMLEKEMSAHGTRMPKPKAAAPKK